jgi:lipid-binding SYLF domain-containing protein
MIRHSRLLTLVLLFVAGAALSLAAMSAIVASAASGVDADAEAALKKLYASVPAAKMIGGQAKAVLVFPRIVKAGFLVGGQYGDGALIQAGTIVGHYNSVAASYGLQAGVQSFGYALFLMNDKALAYLDQSGGWELGVGPSIVVVDKGKATAMATATLRDDAYALSSARRA